MTGRSAALAPILFILNIAYLAAPAVAARPKSNAYDVDADHVQSSLQDQEELDMDADEDDTLEDEVVHIRPHYSGTAQTPLKSEASHSTATRHEHGALLQQQAASNATDLKGCKQAAARLQDRVWFHTASYYHVESMTERSGVMVTIRPLSVASSTFGRGSHWKTIYDTLDSIRLNVLGTNQGIEAAVLAASRKLKYAGEPEYDLDTTGHVGDFINSMTTDMIPKVLTIFTAAKAAVAEAYSKHRFAKLFKSYWTVHLGKPMPTDGTVKYKKGETPVTVMNEVLELLLFMVNDWPEWTAHTESDYSIEARRKKWKSIHGNDNYFDGTAHDVPGKVDGKWDLQETIIKELVDQCAEAGLIALYNKMFNVRTEVLDKTERDDSGINIPVFQIVGDDYRWTADPSDIFH
mmetsp:Transcript_69378/g.166348  ORF Transcript_69378/g.166348 Transcript_69378/m.166348 type:complete len:406 (-) Transcript_69378:256-1473(-)